MRHRTRGPGIRGNRAARPRPGPRLAEEGTQCESPGAPVRRGRVPRGICPPARLVSLLSGSTISNRGVALKRTPSEASVSLLLNAAISPFACQTLCKRNGTRRRRGLRLVLRTAKMPGTNKRLPSGHPVPGGSILSLCLGLPARVRCRDKSVRAWTERLPAGGEAAPQSACRPVHLRHPRAPHPETLGVPGEGFLIALPRPFLSALQLWSP